MHCYALIIIIHRVSNHLIEYHEETIFSELLGNYTADSSIVGDVQIEKPEICDKI